MERLTLEEAKKLNATMVTEDHLILHAANVSAAMGAMAEHFGVDAKEKEEWEKFKKDVENSHPYKHVDTV